MADKAILNKQTSASNELNRGKKHGAFLHSVIVVLIAILVVLLIFFGVFYFAVKNNVNGLADTLQPHLVNRPLLRLVLPEKALPQDPDDQISFREGNHKNMMSTVPKCRN